MLACTTQVAPLGSGGVTLHGHCRLSGFFQATHAITRRSVVKLDYRKSTFHARSTRYSLERGKPEDRKRLFDLLWIEKLNAAAPLVDLESFIVAVDTENDKTTRCVVGGGRLGRLADGVFELGSVVLDPEYRGQGLGGQIVSSVLELAPPQSVVYLITVEERSGFYAPFGFEPVEREDKAPFLLRFEKTLGGALFNTPNLVIMVRK